MLVWKLLLQTFVGPDKLKNQIMGLGRHQGLIPVVLMSLISGWTYLFLVLLKFGTCWLHVYNDVSYLQQRMAFMKKNYYKLPECFYKSLFINWNIKKVHFKSICTAGLESVLLYISLRPIMFVCFLPVLIDKDWQGLKIWPSPEISMLLLFQCQETTTNSIL